MDFLEFEVGTDIVGDMIETAEVGSNTGLKGEVFIEAIASSHISLWSLSWTTITTGFVSPVVNAWFKRKLF